MEVIPGSGSMPFQRHNVEEWSHLDSLTGMLEHARVETGHWSTNTSNSSHKYGKVVDSRARKVADGSVEQRQRKQLEVFQAQVPGGSLQVIRTQSVTSTSSSRTIHGNISSDFENLQLNLNPLDLSSQKTKASVGRSGSIGSRRPPSRPRSIIGKIDDTISEEKQDVDNRLSEVSRLCQQIHEEAKKKSFAKTTPSFINSPSLGDNACFKEDGEYKNDKLENVRSRKATTSIRHLRDQDEITSNGHIHSVLIRKKSCSTEDLQNNEDDIKETTDEENYMITDWKRASKVRRSLQFPSKGNHLDIIPNGNVSKLCKELEENKGSAIRNTSSNLEALENAIRGGQNNNSALLRETNMHTRSNNVTEKSGNEPEGFSRRVNSNKISPHKRHSFVTVESLKEVRGRLRRLSSPPLEGIQHSIENKGVDDSDDGIETEESNKAAPNMNPTPAENMMNSHMKTYMYGMNSANNNGRGNVRKPIPGTGSLESRTSNKSSSSNGSRTEEWYNRRKSYGFEQVHGHQNGNDCHSVAFQDKNKVESSTDSGICRSSETMTASSWSQLFNRPKDENEDSSGSIKVSHSIQIKKYGTERDSSDSEARGTQKGRRTVVTLRNKDNIKNNDDSLKEIAVTPPSSWKNELTHMTSFSSDKNIRRFSEPVTVSIPVTADESFNNSDVSGSIDSKKMFFRQLSEGTNLNNEIGRRKYGSFLENNSERNLSDETKSLAARRELLMKHRVAQKAGSQFRVWNGENERTQFSRQADSEIKRHSIAVDETKYVKNDLENYNINERRKSDFFNYDGGFSTNFKSLSDFEKNQTSNRDSDCKILVDFRSASTTAEDEEQNLIGKKQKKVEFCKTEVHFAAEPGRFNIVETDEKPPPTNMFRRRRRNSVSALTTNQIQETNKSNLPQIRFGDSLYEKKLLGGNENDPQAALSLDSGINSVFNVKIQEPSITSPFQDDADKDDIIYTQANATILSSARQETLEVEVYNDVQEINDDSLQLSSPVNNKPRSILKNNRKPRPFHLGETNDESLMPNLSEKTGDAETRWGIRLKPVQNKEPSVWRSTVSLQNCTFENQQQQQQLQNFVQPEEKFPKHVTAPQSLNEETELQKLLKSLKPASQRKSTGDIFLSPDSIENGVEIKISAPSPVQPSSWSVAERVRQVEDWKHSSLEAKGYSTRINFGAGEATVVETGSSDSQQRHVASPANIYQPNNQRKPTWLQREERKLQTNDVKRQTVSDKGLIVHIGKNIETNVKGEAYSRTEDNNTKKTTTITIDLSPSPSDNKMFHREYDKKAEISNSKIIASGSGSLRSPSLIMKTISKSSLIQDTDDDLLTPEHLQKDTKCNSDKTNQSTNQNESESDTSSETEQMSRYTENEDKNGKTEDDITVVPNQLAALKELYYNAELSDDSERADEEVRSYMSGGDKDDRDEDEDVSSVVSGSWSRMRAFRNIQQHFNKFSQSQKGNADDSPPMKTKESREPSYQRSVATANLQSYSDSNCIRAVETLVSTRHGHPKITSISLKYEGDQSENKLPPKSNKYSEYTSCSSRNPNFQAYNDNELHITEPISSPINVGTYRISKSNVSDSKQTGSSSPIQSAFTQNTKESSSDRKLCVPEERQYENIKPRSPERKTNAYNKDQTRFSSPKRKSHHPEYENTSSLFGKENNLQSPSKFGTNQEVKTSAPSDKRVSLKTNTYVKDQGKRQATSSSFTSEQQKVSLSSLETNSKTSGHISYKRDTSPDMKKRQFHIKEEGSRKPLSPRMQERHKRNNSEKNSQTNSSMNVDYKEREKRSTKLTASSLSSKHDRSLSPRRSIPSQTSFSESKDEEVEALESHIYENILPPLKSNRRDGVETESAILEELTRAADQILQAVNGYTDEESYRASSDDDDEHDEKWRNGGRRKGKRFQVRKISGNLGTISEAPSLKRQSEADNCITDTHLNKSNEHTRKNQRLPKTRLGPTSSTSSIESFTKEVSRTSLNHTNERLNHAQEHKKSKTSTANGAVKSSARSARLLQRASSRELLLQTYGSSSEDGGSVRKPAVPRRTRGHNNAINKTDSVTSNIKITSLSSESQQSPVIKARQRKRETSNTKPKERISGSASKTAPLARKTSCGDSVSKSRTSRSREEEKHWRGSSHPTRRENTDLRHRAQGGGTAVMEASGHDKTERAAVSERRIVGVTKSPASCVVTKKKPALASSHNGSLQAKTTK